MREAANIARLLCINARFSHLTHNDPYLARQIKDAVDQSLADSGGLADPCAYQEALDRLGHAFGLSDDAESFVWIDTERNPECRDPLWLREILMSHLKRLARFRKGTILIAGLSTLFRPPGKRWSPGRRAAYSERVEWLRDFVRNRSLSDHSINLLLV